MFDALSERLGGIFDSLTGRGALSDKDVSEALREIRVALLEADVALPVVKEFIDKVKTRAVGERSSAPSSRASRSSRSSMTAWSTCWAARMPTRRCASTTRRPS